ncbi:Spore germination protein YndE [Clostridium ljungdahlii DSM 13528]|uniref:Spore germination protein KB n=1 Tax=Clostridium ljungdahlii (strain ATCC 55383 / DSM 13528 / PETC) TaxID=748727 RepID=D8GUQ5_CLOLD|nr:endospore germination permease [Clostridium ljungdahlii]ADK16932.1 spore germination protein KB [Clostridium ljungdahlii DSM 13528]OAA85309.1 Spore germination protein YndE [Clostridium ljungdahlii DSM 13528]
MDKIKITNHQLFSLATSIAFGGSVLIVPALVASIAKQDAWITSLLTPAFGIPIIWIYCFLGSQYPDMTLVGIIKKIFGKWIGLIVAGSVVFFYLTIAYHLPWYIDNFITTQVMPQTPAYIISSLFVIAVVIALLYGLETFARASEIIIYFTSILFFLAMILVLPNAKIENIQPVFENGIIPILKSSVFLSCFLTFPLITLMMIYPINLNNISDGKKSLFKGYLWGAFMIFITNFMSILVLGSGITAKEQYPTYLLAKEINVGIVFTRLEFIIAAVWIVTLFIIGVSFFYAGIVGLTELLKLQDYKKIVMPLGLIVLVMSEVVFPDTIYQANWVNFIWTPFSITYGLIVPTLLLFVFFIKKWISKE